MKVFITGATGFIGRRLIDRLLNDGVDVIALVRSPKHDLPKVVHTVQGDILAPDSLGEDGKGCDRLYHLAAMITFDPRQREQLLQINGQGTEHILAAACHWGIERTVVVSSACTIGLSQSPHQILDEEAPFDERLAAHNPYLASKRLTEQVAFRISNTQDVLIVNPTTVYGPGDRTLNSGTLIAQVAKSALMPVPPGGSNVVDVDDVVDGILKAGEQGQSGRRYILGGENLLFSQIFAMIADVVNHTPVFIPFPGWLRRPIAVVAWIAGRVTGSRLLTPQIVGDLFAFKYYANTRARQELGWEPLYGFRQSVERAWMYYQQEGLIRKIL